METLLRAMWHQCVGSSSLAESVLDDLMSRYSEPHRRYHGLAHLRHVVRDVGVLLPSVEIEVHPALIRMAAFFHDAIYSPAAHDNERASAALARIKLLELGVAEAAISEVERLILTTIDHLADDAAAIVLADADLAILGADPAAYQAYVTGVRAEYAHVSDAAWAVGRPQVLRRFLERPAIFRTEPMQHRESRARANLTTEIRLLERLGDPNRAGFV